MKTVIAALMASATYATLRYNVFKGVPWSEWPIYTLNKAIALAALALFVIDVLRRARGRNGMPDEGLLVAGWRLMLLHVALSLAMLGPEYYPKFFEEERLTFSAGVSALLGAVAGVGFHTLPRDPRRQAEGGWLVRLGVLCFIVGLHAAFLGALNWFAPATWPGYMPPITLFAFAAASVALLASFRRAAGTAPDAMRETN